MSQRANSALVKIVDDALPTSQFRKLLRAVKNLGAERRVSSYQTTFWHPLGAPAESMLDPVVEALRPLVPNKRYAGVEWWLSRMRTSNVKVDFHRDRDNARFDHEGVSVHPTTSSLLYLTSCRGGLLAVTKADPNPKNDAFAPDVHDFDFVEPKPNRFCWFDGRLTHGVLDANNAIPTRRLRTEPDWRLAVAINWWAAPPRDVPTFAQSRHYRSLAAHAR